jgi:hypothetical protein
MKMPNAKKVGHVYLAQLSWPFAQATEKVVPVKKACQDKLKLGFYP